ncbi:nuclear transport factor 2 family protein [Streptomyces sp. NPDC001941]|uniref:nuclear transport factor 2 family protein n=1 Tax=Streptomyces sp. NPDC001941 TaxID=3154659 RepID=UPI00332D3603
MSKTTSKTTNDTSKTTNDTRNTTMNSAANDTTYVNATAPRSTRQDASLVHDVRHLLDRAEITDLFDGYLRSLDDREFDEAWAARHFTPDARTRTPAGDVHGRDAVLANVRTALALFDRTVHFGSNYVIDIDGDRATLRGNQLSTHVLAGGGGLFLSGGRTENELVRTDAGWRLVRADLHVSWTQGEPPVLPPELLAARGGRP